jgi:DNA-binding transcriptional ArsR family regulator
MSTNGTALAKTQCAHCYQGIPGVVVSGGPIRARRRFPSTAPSETQRRRALAYLANPSSVTEIARGEGVSPSAVSQSLAAPVIAMAIERILDDFRSRRCLYSEWRARHLPRLLLRFGLKE